MATATEVIYAEELTPGSSSSAEDVPKVLPSERIAQGKKLPVAAALSTRAAVRRAVRQQGKRAAVRGTVRLVGKAPSARPDWIKFGALTHPAIKLRQPIHLQVVAEHGTVSVFWPEATEFGYGPTMGEALDDFARTVVELYTRLNEHDVQLGADLLKVKQLLSTYIESRSR